MQFFKIGLLNAHSGVQLLCTHSGQLFKRFTIQVQALCFNVSEPITFLSKIKILKFHNNFPVQNY